MQLSALVVLIVLLGCSHYNYPYSEDGLKAQGYQPIGSKYTNDKTPQVAYYQIWAKETRDDGRRVHLCIVPGWSSGGYVWRATVFVDDRETWKYSYGGGSSQPPLLSGISCTTSDPLPDGVVTWRTGYTYWH